MAKRLIVCSDGTWGTLEGPGGSIFAQSNVAKIALAIRPRGQDDTPQIVFYDPGVGTGNLLDKFSGGIFGVGLSENVKDAYRFLMHNYEGGDEVYFFGFSRGAYTVRSVAGLIRKCGLLHKQHARLLDCAYDLYRKRDGPKPDTPEAIGFRGLYSRDIEHIKFVGVWDTVGALGIPIDLPFRVFSKGLYEFHDVTPTRRIEYAYQALAIDEKRGPFEPTLWEQSPEAEAVGQVLEQAWFAGEHMDVGGGWQAAGLSDFALRWMVEKASATGLAFEDEAVSAMCPDEFATEHDSFIPPFSFLPPYVRPIGKGYQANEAVHPAVLERYRRNPCYRPANLVSYLLRHPASGGRRRRGTR